MKKLLKFPQICDKAISFECVAGGCGDEASDGSLDGWRTGAHEVAHEARWDSGGWWFLTAQLAAADMLALVLVSGGELWSVRETGGPWRLPSGLCTPFMGLEAMLSAAQTYLLVALALHARATPADPVPSKYCSTTASHDSTC